MWKDIIYKGIDYTGIYQISDTGQVRSMYRTVPKAGKRSTKGKLIKAQDNGNGYLMVWLSKNGKRKPAKIHSLVVTMFQRSLEKGEDIDHKDSNTQNNNSSNLVITTHRGNCSKERTQKSGLPVGVSIHKKVNRPQASIRVDGHYFYLGLYNTVQQAAKAYQLVLNIIISTKGVSIPALKMQVNNYRKKIGLKLLRASKVKD